MSTMIIFLLLILLLLNNVNAVQPGLFASSFVKLKSLEKSYDAIATITVDDDFIASLEFMTTTTPSHSKKYRIELIVKLKNAVKSLLRRQCPQLAGDVLHQSLNGLKNLGIPADYADKILTNKYKLQMGEIDNIELGRLFKESFLELIEFQIKQLKNILSSLQISDKTEIKELHFLKSFIEKSSSSFDNELISKLQNELQLRPKPDCKATLNSIILFKKVLENYFKTKRGNVKLLSRVLEALKILLIPVKFVAEVIHDLNELERGNITNENFITNLKMKFSVHLQQQIKMKDLNLKLPPQ